MRWVKSSQGSRRGTCGWITSFIYLKGQKFARIFCFLYFYNHKNYQRNIDNWQRKIIMAMYTMGEYRATVVAYRLWNEGIPFPRKSDIRPKEPNDFDRAVNELAQALDRTGKLPDSENVPHDLIELLREFERRYVIFDEVGKIKRVVWFDKSQSVIDISDVKS